MMRDWNKSIADVGEIVYEYTGDINPFIRSLKVIHFPLQMLGPAEESDMYQLVYDVGPIIPDIYKWHSDPTQLLWLDKKDKLHWLSDEMSMVREDYAVVGPQAVDEYVGGFVYPPVRALMPRIAPELGGSVYWSIEDFQYSDDGIVYTSMVDYG
ncbi:MAG: hypothetical protein HOK52_12960 [Candidatus Marinimicrobia bacterium]|jgi:hypothetical protein|nr:hypothetical protein [Candidatus Neomarinimicrobiota bacterium]